MWFDEVKQGRNRILSYTKIQAIAFFVTARERMMFNIEFSYWCKLIIKDGWVGWVRDRLYYHNSLMLENNLSSEIKTLVLTTGTLYKIYKQELSEWQENKLVKKEIRKRN